MPKVVILGSGCAGLTAAIYSARANLQPLVVEGGEVGGQLSLTTDVENFPGFPHGIQGPELIRLMKEQAARFGAQFMTGQVTQANLSASPFQLAIDGQTIEAEALIIATGASARLLQLESGKKPVLGYGVSTCATCDGFFYREKKVMVVGGGDTAMEEATFLTKFATTVTIVHRRDEFRASKIMLDRARNNPKIRFLMNTVIADIDDHEKGVERVKLRNTKTNAVTEEEINGVFIAIGHDPNTSVFKGQLATDADGYLITAHGPCTSIPGVYAAGDVQDRHYRQAITAAGSGCMAAIEAERWLSAQAAKAALADLPPSTVTTQGHA